VGETGRMPMPQEKLAACGVGETGRMPMPQEKLAACGVGVPPAQSIGARSQN
jgi:hypothetical protein